MNRLTDEQLAEIRKRAEAATAGPWGIEDGEIVSLTELIADLFPSTVCDGYDSQGTAEFIAHAREDVPKLLAEIERLTKVIKYVNDLSEEFYTEVTEDNSVAIPNTERHKHTMQEIFVVTIEAVNHDGSDI